MDKKPDGLSSFGFAIGRELGQIAEDSGILERGYSVDALLAMQELRHICDDRGLGHAVVNLMMSRTLDASLNGQHPIRERMAQLENLDQTSQVLGMSALFLANDYINNMTLANVTNNGRFKATHQVDRAMEQVLQHISKRPDLVRVVPRSNANRQLHIVPDTLSPKRLVAAWTYRRLAVTGVHTSRVRMADNPNEITELETMVDINKRSSFVVDISPESREKAPSLVDAITDVLLQQRRSLERVNGQIHKIKEPGVHQELIDIFDAQDDDSKGVIIPVDTTYIGARRLYNTDRFFKEPATLAEITGQDFSTETAMQSLVKFIKDPRRYAGRDLTNDELAELVNGLAQPAPRNSFINPIRHFRSPRTQDNMREVSDYLRDVAFDLAQSAGMSSAVVSASGVRQKGSRTQDFTAQIDR